jgi:hypothetical protein
MESTKDSQDIPTSSVPPSETTTKPSSDEPEIDCGLWPVDTDQTPEPTDEEQEFLDGVDEDMPEPCNIDALLDRETSALEDAIEAAYPDGEAPEPVSLDDATLPPDNIDNW